MPNYTPTVLTIAGSDPYGGAGVQVDAKTIHALDGYAFSVTTALTAQNSTGVKAVYSTPKEIFKQQLESILDDICVDAVKIGMLGNRDIVLEVIHAIDKYKLKNIVLDTVLISSSGKPLLESRAIDTMVKELFPRVDLITPNIPEINTLLGTNYIGNKDEVSGIASAFFDLGANTVLIKGGHSADKEKATDYLAQKNSDIKAYATQRLTTTHTHGTGCVLSSAIATYLSLGYSLEKSVECSKAFLYKGLHTSSSIKFNYTEEKNDRKEPIL